MARLASIENSLTEQDDRTDQELVSAANAGEASAFAGIYFRYREWAVNLAFRFTADRDQALDIMQETFLYLLKKFPGFTLTCQMKSLLYPVVKHLALNARAKSSRYQSGEELFAGLEAPRAEPLDDEALRAALSKLPPHHREVVVLRFIEGLELAEISQSLAVPLGTVKSRLHHALEALRGSPNLREYFE